MIFADTSFEGVGSSLEDHSSRLQFLEPDQIDELLPWWSRCFEACENPFLNPFWVRLKVEQWLGERAQFAVYFGESGQMECMFPLRFRGREIDLIGSGICDFQDVVAMPGTDVRPAMKALADWAIENNHFIKFRKLSTKGKLYHTLTDSDWDENFCVDRALHGPCPYFEHLGGDMMAVTKHFSKSTRKKVRRRLRILSEDFDPKLKVTSDFDSATIEKIAAIHIDRHQGDSLFTVSDFRGFLKSVMTAVPGLIRCYTLESEKHGLMGFEVGVVKDDTYFSWMGGYDPSLYDYRIGTCLMALIMEDLGGRGFTHYDFLCGGENYKFHFNSGEYSVYTVTIRQRRIDNLARLKLQIAKRKAAPTVKTCLNRVGLYQTNYRIDRE